MAGRFERLIGVKKNTGKKLYREESINLGTRALFDMQPTWSGGGKNLIAGSAIKTLTWNTAEGTFNKAKNYSNGGMVYAGISTDYFELPSVAVPDPADKHWLFTAWLKITDPGSSGFNNQTLNIGVTGNNIAAGTVLGIIQTVTSGAVSQVQMRVNAVSYVPGSTMFPLYDGAVHQLAIEYERNDAGTQQRVIVYIDKVAVFNSGWGNVASTAPVAAVQRIVGTSGTFSKAWGGSLYRVRMDDLVGTGLTPADILSADYSESKHRFS